MKIRFVFRCSLCGSNSYRPSSQLTFRDTLLLKIGVRPQRCFLCRRRFYIFRPSILRSLLTGSAQQSLENKKPADRVIESSRRMSA
jgi:hypothetical protein